MTRLAPKLARPINWRALNASGTFGPGRHRPRDSLLAYCLVATLVILAGIAFANECGAFR